MTTEQVKKDLEDFKSARWMREKLQKELELIDGYRAIVTDGVKVASIDNDGGVAKIVGKMEVVKTNLLDQIDTIMYFLGRYDKAIESLTYAEQEAIHLRYFDGLTIEKTTNEMHYSKEGMMRGILKTAIEKIAEYVE